MTFAMEPEFVRGISQAQKTASTAINTAFSAVTPAQLSSFAGALGALAVPNMIPAMFESTANNVMSGLMTAANHEFLGVATDISQNAVVAADTPTDV